MPRFTPAAFGTVFAFLLSFHPATSHAFTDVVPGLKIVEVASSRRLLLRSAA